MTPKIAEQLKDLRKGTLALRRNVRTFEEEIVVNSIRYSIEQAKLVFKNHNNKDKR